MDVILILVSWLLLLVPGFDESVPLTGDNVFKIETEPDIVESITVQSDESFDFWGLDIQLKQNSTGTLVLKIPKNLPTPASLIHSSWSHAEKPFVLADGDEIMFDATEDSCYYQYNIPIGNQTNLEIIYSVIAAGTWKLYSPLEFDESHPCYAEVFDVKSVKSPLKQFKSGIPFDEIQCKDNLVLIQKSDGSPACVKPKSINTLILRGWADEKFRTLPIIDFQNPDRIFREVGYLGLMMLLPHIEENHTIAISLEGKPNMVLPIIQYYEVDILSEKTNNDKSFSSVFGKITKQNLQKFFEENPMNTFVKRGVLLASLGGYQDNTGTYGPFNQFLTDNESQIIGDILTDYENKRTNEEDIHFSDFVKWPTGKINEIFLQK